MAVLRQFSKEQERKEQERKEQALKQLTNEIKKLFQEFEKKRERALKKQDPNFPKRPRSAYCFFCMEMRSQVRKDNPGLHPRDTTRKLAEMWRGQADRACWNEMYKQDCVRYQKAMDAFNEKWEKRTD